MKAKTLLLIIGAGAVAAWLAFSYREELSGMVTDATAPRGIRNNNPGNTVRGSSTPLGAATDQSGDDRFWVFVSAEYGLRWIAYNLLNYSGRKWNTARLIAEHWAPASDGNDTDEYARGIAKAAGVSSVDVVLDMRSQAGLVAIMRGIVRNENGLKLGVSDWYTATQYNRGALMALQSKGLA